MRGRGKGRMDSDCYMVSFWGDENILRLKTVKVEQLCEYTKSPYCTP